MATIGLAVACSRDSGVTGIGSPTLTELSVSPSSFSASVGDTIRFLVSGTDAQGRPTAVGSVRWQLSSSAIGQITQDGLFTAAAPGQVDVSAVSGPVSAAAHITVQPSIAASIELAPSQIGLVPGASAQVAAVVRDPRGTILPGQSVSWTVTDSSRVLVDPSGKVTGLAPGIASIRATVQGVSASAPVLVNALGTISVSIDRTQIGGTGLAVGSSVAATAAVQGGAVSVQISSEVPQVIFAIDANNDVRGLALSSIVNHAATVHTIDAVSTALALLFTSPHVGGSSLAAADTVLARLTRLQSFSTLSKYLATALPSTNLQAVERDPAFQSLFHQVVVDYSKAISAMARAKQWSAVQRLSQSSGAPGSSSLVALRTFASIDKAQDVFTNYGMRAVAVWERDLDAAGNELRVVERIAEMPGASPFSLSGLAGSIIDKLTGGGFDFGVTPASIAQTVSVPQSPPNVVQIWVVGPGLNPGVARPSSIPGASITNWGLTMLNYVIMPSVGAFLGPISLDGEDQEALVDAISGFQSVIGMADAASRNDAGQFAVDDALALNDIVGLMKGPVFKNAVLKAAQRNGIALTAAELDFDLLVVGVGVAAVDLTTFSADFASESKVESSILLSSLGSASKSGGDAQSGTSGQVLPQPIAVRVLRRDAPGPIPGVAVFFSTPDGGYFTQTPSSGAAKAGNPSYTDANGVAQAYWVLGPTGGAQSATASVAFVANSPLAFSATAKGSNSPAGAPPPTVVSLSPSSYPGSTSPQLMTILGSNFGSGASLTFDDPQGNAFVRPAGFVSSSQLTHQFNNQNDAGTWSVFVTNLDGQSSKTLTFPVTAGQSSTASGFSVLADPSIRIVAPGQSTSFSLTIQSTGSFSGPVTLAALSLPTNASGATFSPNPVTLAAGAVATSTLTLSTTSSTPPSTYLITLRAAGGSVIHDVPITTLVQQPAPATVTITTAANPLNSGTVSGGGTVPANSSVTLTAGAASGYVFDHWTEGGLAIPNAGANYSFIATTSRSLVANFSSAPIAYSISTGVLPLTGGSVSGGGTVPANSVVTLTATPANGYQFDHWSEGSNAISTSTGATYTFVATANRSIIANFTPIQQSTYTVTTPVNPANSGSVAGGGTFPANTVVTLTATPAAGFQFDHWSEGNTTISSSTGAAYTFVLVVSRTIVANFRPVGPTTFTITTSVSPASSGSVIGGGTVAANSSVTLTAAPASGFVFDHWSENGATIPSAGASYTFAATANRSLVANFVTAPPTIYTITTGVLPLVGGSVSGGGQYPATSVVTLTATPATGYQFDHWSEGTNTISTSTGATYTFLATVNRSIIANFSPIQQTTYTVTTPVSPANSGTVAGAGTFPANTVVTLTAMPATGFQFDHWSEGSTIISSSGGATYTFVLIVSRTIVANFKPINPTTFTISTSVSPANSGSVAGGGVVLANSTVTLTAAAASGFKFDRWTELGVTIASAASYTFTATADRSLVANFLVNVPAPTVTVTAVPSTIPKFQSTTVSWTSTNATVCAGQWDNFSSALPIGGNKTFQPTANTIYMVQCTGPGGTGSGSAAVTVTDPLPTVSVTASPSTVVIFHSTTVSWTSTDATSCAGQWDNFTSVLGTSGSKSFTPTSTTIYEVHCIGPGGTGIGQTKVTVTSGDLDSDRFSDSRVMRRY